MSTNLNFLNSFLEVAKTLNFSEASKNLRMAQPGLSRQIKQLESSLGVDLFLRDNKRVSLTGEGEFLAENLEPLLSNLNKLLSDVKDCSDSLFGEVKIATPLEIGELLIAPICQAFSKVYPDINISLTYVGMSEIPTLLLNGDVDFGIGIRVLDQENIRTYKVLEQDSFLLCSNRNASLTTTEEMNFASYRKNDPLILNFLKTFFPKSTYSKLNFKFCANSHQSIVNYLVDNDDTFGVLPYFSKPVKEAIENKELFIIDDCKLETTIYLMTNVETSTPKRKTLFKEFFLVNIKNYR